MSLRLVAALVLLILVGYAGIAAWPILSGPSLAIATPGDFETLADGHAVIEGKANHTETLWLNGAPLLMDESGSFKTVLTLPSGGAILSLTATDRFGREITERRSVFVN